jgi:hypothetical protein
MSMGSKGTAGLRPSSVSFIPELIAFFVDQALRFSLYSGLIMQSSIVSINNNNCVTIQLQVTRNFAIRDVAYPRIYFSIMKIIKRLFAATVETALQTR